MSKSKSTQSAAQPQMTRQEREEARKQIAELSKVTPEQLIELMKKEPGGQLSVNVILDALWPKFKHAFKIGMPAKGKHVPQAVYDRQLAEYREWTKGIKSIAKFWYCCGMLHTQNFDDLCSILDASQDADAPEASDANPKEA